MSTKAGYASIPSAVAMPLDGTNMMVDIVAPADMAEGYTFEASYVDRKFQITVPPGGVVEGQRFSVPAPPPTASTHLFGAVPIVSGVPLHRWKDGLCSCLKYGCCHPSFLNALCLPQLLLAQVATRMKLDWLGNDALSSLEYRNTFCKMATILFGFFLVSFAITPYATVIDIDEGGNVKVIKEAPLWYTVVSNLSQSLFAVYTLVVFVRVRRSIRERYRIREERCLGCEDFCCAFCCGCCTVAQMARHTADYEERRAMCFSATGLPRADPEGPAILV